MTNDTHNYKQLIELAVLDAHGLLEPIESDLFNRSFHDAPASIQDDIIRMQRDFALDETYLPTISPPDSLKRRVLRSVAQAADKEAQRLAPLALIGARANAARSMNGLTKPAYFWRTAALILFGVAVVFGIMAVDSNRRATRISQLAMNFDTSSTITDALGVEYASFIDNPYCVVTWLQPESTDRSNDRRIRVSLNELFGDGYIACFDLEEGEEIIIQGTTTSGAVIELARITASGPISGHTFSIDKALVPGMTIAAFNAKTGSRWI